MPRWLDLFRASLLLLWAIPALAGELLPAPDGLTGYMLAKRAEDTLRSTRTHIAAVMTVISPRLSQPRVVSFESWDDVSSKRSFIRIESPAKDRGTSFLKLHPNMWMYVPRVERTMRIPPSMMMQSWMGSDFTNDDLVRESSELEDYDHVLKGLDPSPPGHPGLQAYVVEYIPHEEAPVVWGRIVAWIEVEHGTPLHQDFYDEAGERLRAMEFGDIRIDGDRHVPHSWVMTPLDKEGHETRIEIRTFDFDAEFDEALFTKRNLTRARR